MKYLEFQHINNIDLTYTIDFKKIIDQMLLNLQIDTEIGIYHQEPMLDFKEFTDYILKFIDNNYGNVKDGISIKDITSLYFIYALNNIIWN